jgi:hypothetical protein
MPRTMPTLSLPGPRHSLQRVVLLGMDIPPGGSNIAVPGQILEREDIHMRSPASEARVPKCVKVEGLNFRQLAGISVLLLEA